MKTHAAALAAKDKLAAQQLEATEQLEADLEGLQQQCAELEERAQDMENAAAAHEEQVRFPLLTRTAEAGSGFLS
jgi:phage shock protein A